MARKRILDSSLRNDSNAPQQIGKTDGNVNGRGGEAVFTDTNGAVLVYHYYDGNNNGDPALGINTLGWTADDWPYVEQ